MRRGERVLIHSATGGVGLAAVQMALQAGAIVFATAGSPEKRDLLTALGVPHVMDSRTSCVRRRGAETDPRRGSRSRAQLARRRGDRQSLSLVLRQFGRFVDIGLTRHLPEPQDRNAAAAQCLSLFAVDLDHVFHNRKDLVHSMMGDVWRAGSNATSCSRSPHRVFPVERVADAFRTMAQAKHVGKLVVSMKDAEGL